ncbi:hypothetical protein ACFL41_02555 [Gemmatimonadota bacterium]
MSESAGITVFIVIIIALFLFIGAIWWKIKKKMLGAMTDILNADQQRAAEVIVLQEAKKKMTEQDQGEPEDPEPIPE